MEKVLKVGDKDYKLRLTSWQVRCLEEREQKGIIALLQEMETGGSLVQPIVKILHASLLDSHSDLKIREVYDIYDSLVNEQGYNIDKLGELVMEVLKQAGLFTGKMEK